jgi:hypothetical protein
MTHAVEPGRTDADSKAVHRGRCQCGGVAYRTVGRLRDVFNCHCARCRRFTGHHMAATAIQPERLAFESDSTLRWYSPVDDPGVHYGFSGDCGSSLFWRADAHPEKISICAGTLDLPTGLVTTQAWFVADAADYHRRADGLSEFATE